MNANSVRFGGVVRMAAAMAMAIQCSANAQMSGFLGRAKEALMLPGSETTEAKTVSFPPYSGPRHTLAVGEFKNDARGGGSGLSASLRTSLEAALQQSGYFDIYDRSDWDPQDGEREDGDFGSIQRAAYKVFGHITAVEETGDQKFDIPVSFGGHKPKIGIGGKQTTIRLTAKVVHVKTGRTVAHRDVVGKSNAAGLRITGLFDQGRGGVEKNARTSDELAAINTVYEMTKFVCEEMQKIAAPGAAPTAPFRVTRVGADSVTVDTSGSGELRVGDDLVLLDEDGFPEPGFKARVQFVQPGKAKCAVLESDREIQPGAMLSAK